MSNLNLSAVAAAPGQAEPRVNLTADMGNPIANQSTLEVLALFKHVLGDEPVFAKMASEEVRYLKEAMTILTTGWGNKNQMVNGVDTKGEVIDKKEADTPAGQAALRLQEKYGRTLEGAVELAEVLKLFSDKAEVEEMLQPHIEKTLLSKGAGRLGRSGVPVPEAGWNPVFTGAGRDAALGFGGRVKKL